MRLISILVLITTFFNQSTAALAQSFLEEYQAYNEAIETGNIADAIVHGEAAWRAAESEGADDQSIAILAYNYAYLIYYNDPASAIEPLTKVIEIMGEENPAFESSGHPILLRNIASAKTSPEDRSAYKALKELLERYNEETRSPTISSARGWITIASYDFSKNNFSKATEASDNSVSQYQALVTEPNRELANAYLLAGIGRVAGDRRNRSDIQEAYDHLGNAIRQYPPQTDIDSFDPGLGITLAWSAATRAAAQSDFSNEEISKFFPSRIKPKLEKLPEDYPSLKWTSQRPSISECGIKWKSRKAPQFPRRELKKGTLAGIIIGYHLDEDGTVDTTRLLGEVPTGSRFGTLAQEAMVDWQLEPGFVNSDACLRNQVITFFFIIEH